mgnify:FL=1
MNITITPPKDESAADAAHSPKRQAFQKLCVYPLLALGITVVVELFNHKTFTEGFSSLFEFITDNPLALLVDALIVLVTLVPALFLRRRVFWCVLATIVWLVAGGVNGFILLNRMTPFTMSDLTVLNTGLDTLPNYLSTGYIVLLAVALILSALGLILLFWKGPRNALPLKKRILMGILGMLVSGGALAGGWALAFQTNQLSTTFANLAFAYEDYGFSYCFLQTWLNKGIHRPSNYSQQSVNNVLDMLEEDSDPSSQPQTDVNVIFVQLESFIDPAQIKDLTLSEDAVPNWRRLSEEFSSGYLTVPVVGAGTANTECEVLTGMSTRFFGPGEYPYETTLMDQTAESVAYNLKENGYATHAIHNHRATFYSRNVVYGNLGFDDFTALEYMPQVPTTPKNWAKDAILTSQIVKALNTTEDQPDLVFTVSVQGHGKYPMDPVLEDPEITVVSYPDEDYHYAVEYYVNQVHEMDEFVGNLTETLSKRDEKTILVLYGDHLPALGLEAKDMEAGSLYRTQYIIWDNFGLAKEDEDMAAYQLSAAVLGRLGITNGIFNAYHQFCREESNYWSGLRTLQYDAMEGQKYLYDGTSPYQPTDMQMGMAPITLDHLSYMVDSWVLSGSNFSPYCEVRNADGDLLETEYISSNLLRILEDPGTDNVADLSVSVVDKHREILSDTE